MKLANSAKTPEPGYPSFDEYQRQRNLFRRAVATGVGTAALLGTVACGKEVIMLGLQGSDPEPPVEQPAKLGGEPVAPAPPAVTPPATCPPARMRGDVATGD